jgi:TolB protein
MTTRHLRALAACAVVLAAPVAAIASAQSPKTNGSIAFMRYAGKQEDDHSAQIFTTSPAGAVRQLTHVPGGAFDPAWSPDGSRIAFERWFASQGNPDQLFTMKADGTDMRPLTTGCDRSSCLGDDWPAYSPDGTKIAFIRNVKPLIRTKGVEHATAADLMVVGSAGGAPTVLQHFAADPQPSAPAWSPDGTQLVFALSTLNQPSKHTAELNALFLIGADGTAMRQITPFALGASDPQWSPDGKSIVFNSQGGHSPFVYVVRPDGGGLRRITRKTRVYSRNPKDARTGFVAQWQPSWSPDGKRIVFAREVKPCASRYRNGCLRRTVPNNLFVMNADGTHVQRLTKSARLEGQPAWGPSSKGTAR